VTNEDGGGRHCVLWIGEEVKVLDQVDFFSLLGIVVVPRHEVGQNESSHDGNPLKI